MIKSNALKIADFEPQEQQDVILHVAAHDAQIFAFRKNKQDITAPVSAPAETMPAAQEVEELFDISTIQLSETSRLQLDYQKALAATIEMHAVSTHASAVVELVRWVPTTEGRKRLQELGLWM